VRMLEFLGDRSPPKGIMSVFGLKKEKQSF